MPCIAVEQAAHSIQLCVLLALFDVSHSYAMRAVTNDRILRPPLRPVFTVYYGVQRIAIKKAHPPEKHFMHPRVSFFLRDFFFYPFGESYCAAALSPLVPRIGIYIDFTFPVSTLLYV